jgi:exonuclease III
MFSLLTIFSIFHLLIISRADPECPLVSTSSTNKKGNLRLVQYNVEWLFIDYYSPADCPGQHCTWHNYSEASIHLNYVSDVLSTLNGDIVNLCEVEGCDELSDLAISNPNLGYSPFLKKGTDSATGQNVGLLSRIFPQKDLYRSEEKVAYPIPNSKCGYTGSSLSQGVSKHYITFFEWGDHPVLFIGAHLLAYPTDPTRCAEREAQAQVIQNIIHQYPEHEIVVLGDFNDFDGETIDSNGNKPISRVLDILKGNDGAYAGSYLLHSAADLIDPSERWSDWWDQNNDCVSSPNEFSMIDHVLVSPWLFSHITKAFIYHGYSEFCGKYNSDHYPLIVDFMF